jgi:secondary thiamine-phosphate synthase enzyme
MIRRSAQPGTSGERFPITMAVPEIIATTVLDVETSGPGFFEVTGEAKRFIADARGEQGTLLLHLQHTSASLVIQENADPDVRADLAAALDRLAPAGAGWVHDAEGPDDMPAHVKSMLTGVSLQIPVLEGVLALGTWQGIYLAEHRAQPHRRKIVLQFIGSRR